MTRLADVYAKQGHPLPQTDAEWESFTKHKMDRRRANVSAAREVLGRNEIAYSEPTPSYFLIQTDTACVDYWPETGVWTCKSKSTGEQVCSSFGVRNLVKFINGGVVK